MAVIKIRLQIYFSKEILARNYTSKLLNNKPTRMIPSTGPSQNSKFRLIVQTHVGDWENFRGFAPFLFVRKIHRSCLIRILLKQLTEMFASSSEFCKRTMNREYIPKLRHVCTGMLKHLPSRSSDFRWPIACVDAASSSF